MEKIIFLFCTLSAVAGIKSNILPIPGSGECGIDTSDKIYGGTATTLDEFPWTALLQHRTYDGNVGWDCSGVLISSRYVLTAAHCIPKTEFENNITSVRLGEWDLNTNPDCDVDACADPVQDIGVEQIISHPNYNPSESEENDIAIIRLKKPAKFSYFVKPICLPLVKALLPNSTEVGKTFVIAGWGTTETGRRSHKKLKVEVREVEHSICKNKYANHTSKLTIFASQLCAGGEKDKDSCQGDSGGPLMGLYNDRKGGNYFYLVGIVSNGIGCGIAGWPGVYTRVSSYISWIQSNIRE